MFARGGAFPCDLSFLAVFAGFFLALISDYFEDFKSADAEKLYTKIDSNGDGKTWSYVASDHCMRTNYSSASADDDWFVTPRIHLTPDRTYTVSFSAKNRYPKDDGNRLLFYL